VSDFESEMQMAQMNRTLGVETLFLPTSSSHSFIASKLLREVAATAGRSAFVPKAVTTVCGTSSPPGGEPWTREPVTDLFDDQHSGREDDSTSSTPRTHPPVIDVVGSAKAMPLSASVLISRDESRLLAGPRAAARRAAQAAGCCVSARNSSPSAP